MFMRKFVNYWISRPRDGFYVFLAVCFAVLYAAGVTIARYDRPEMSVLLKRIGFIGFLALAVLVFIHKNLNAFYEFLRMFKDTDHLPQKQISYVNSFCMTVFLIAAVILIAAAAAAAGPLWQIISAWFSGLPRASASPRPEPEPVRGGDTMTPNLAELLGDGGPAPAWVKLLDAVFEKLGFLLIAAAALFLLWHIGKSLWGFLTRPRHFDEDEKIYLKPTLNMQLNIKPRDREGGPDGLRYHLSYNARIRRHYRREILSGRKKQKQNGAPPPWAAPAELESTSGLDDELLHNLYEKARYSREGCGEEDWNRITAARKTEGPESRSPSGR